MIRESPIDVPHLTAALPRLSRTACASAATVPDPPGIADSPALRMAVGAPGRSGDMIRRRGRMTLTEDAVPHGVHDGTEATGMLDDTGAGKGWPARPFQT